METHISGILFFIHAVSKSSPKISLTFGWKQSLCVIIHVSFFSCFLLLFLIFSHLNFSSLLTPCLLLSLFPAFCISFTLPLNFLLILSLYNLAFGSFSLYVLHPFGSLFLSSSLFSRLLQTLFPSFSALSFLCPILSLHLSLRSQ